MLNRHAISVAAVLAVALTARAGWVAWRFPELSQDPDVYVRIADHLLAGRGFSSYDPPRPTAFRPPLYVMLVAAVRLLDGPLLLGALQILLGVASVWLTIRIGRRLGLGRWSEFAGFLCAVDPILVRYTSLPMTEVTFAFLVAMFLWAVVRDRPSQLDAGANKDADRHPFCVATPRGFASQCLAGVLFGLCALCRPTIWAYGALCAAVWLIAAIYCFGKGERMRVPFWGVLCAFATVLPWGVRNLAVLGKPIVTTTHGGYTLLLGNNPVFYREVVAKPWGTVWPNLPAESSQAEWLRRVNLEMTAELGERVNDETARDQWMYLKAREHMRADPEMFARSCWLRLRRLWNVVPLGEDASRLPVVAGWMVGGFNTIVLLLAVGGMISLLVPCRAPVPASMRRIDWLWLCLLPVSFSALHLLYWSNARMRAPLVPVVCLLAAELLRRWLPGTTDKPGESM